MERNKAEFVLELSEEAHLKIEGALDKIDIGAGLFQKGVSEVRQVLKDKQSWEIRVKKARDED